MNIFFVSVFVFVAPFCGAARDDPDALGLWRLPLPLHVKQRMEGQAPKKIKKVVENKVENGMKKELDSPLKETKTEVQKNTAKDINSLKTMESKSMDFGSNFRKEMRKMQQDMEKGLGMALAPVDDFGRNMRKEMKKMQAEMQKGFGMAPFKELAPLKAKLKDMSQQLQKTEKENFKKDSGLKKSKSGPWDFISRDIMAKSHKNGVQSFKVGAAEVGDKNKNNEKEHQVKKVMVKVEGSDPETEKRGEKFRSVEKREMFSNQWSNNSPENGASAQSQSNEMRSESHSQFVQSSDETSSRFKKRRPSFIAF